MTRNLAYWQPGGCCARVQLVGLRGVLDAVGDGAGGLARDDGVEERGLEGPASTDWLIF